MKIVILGASGQVGTELKHRFKDSKFETITFTRAQLDVTNYTVLFSMLNEKHPNLVINATAFTKVDKAEVEREKSKGVNSDAVGQIALACKKIGCSLIHISTDYVFDGLKGDSYVEDDETHPINAYGKDKLEGEKMIRKILNNYFIIRTSWVFSLNSPNFIKTIINKALHNQETINIVDDQIGNPTSAKSLANFIFFLANKIYSKKDINYGTYHFSNQPNTSWYNLTVTLFDYLRDLFPEKKFPDVNKIKTEELDLAAKRPRQSSLSCKKVTKTFNYRIPDWRDELKDIMKDFA